MSRTRDDNRRNPATRYAGLWCVITTTTVIILVLYVLPALGMHPQPSI